VTAQPEVEAFDVRRDLLAELVGTGALVAIVVGSGAMAQRLSAGDVSLQLFENAAATGVGLFTLIAVFSSISKAHFNPVLTLVDVLAQYEQGGRREAWAQAAGRAVVQVLGAVGGVLVANAMFELPLLGAGSTDRGGGSMLLAEVVATAGLAVVVFGLMRAGRAHLVAPAVGCYIAAAYFFTASTSFANPAVTIGRALTDSFAGIAPANLPAFIGAQLVGGLVGWAFVRVLWPSSEATEVSDVGLRLS
jgi:glycerol uptake facilitator-like aquaporin